MKDYTGIFAHLEDDPGFEVGDKVQPGDIIGRMGNTGQSSGAHLHFGNFHGKHKRIIRLREVSTDGPIKFALEQGLYFIDEGLFGGVPYIVTTHVGDPFYYHGLKEVPTHNKYHWGWDLVPADRRETDKHFDIHWNRSFSGEVNFVDFDPNGYGWIILIGYRR